MSRPDLEAWADDRFLADPSFAKRKTFGCPSYYRGKKMFAFIYEDALGIKLPPQRVLEKIKEDPDVYAPFSPGDGVMKNWLMITLPEAEEYEREWPLIEEAMESF
jgi:hypothetical protein